VFVVASARKGFDPAEVLFEFEGVRRDTAPSRGTGQEVAGCAASRTDGGGFPGTDEACSGYIQAVEAFGGGRTGKGLDVAGALLAQKGWKGDFETETFLVQSIAHTLRGEGFDASEDGAGRGTPIVPVCFDTTQITSAANYSNPKPGDPCHPLAAGAHPPAIAFPARLSGTQCASTEELAPSMGAKNPTGVAYAIQAGAIKTNPNIGPDGIGIRSDDCAYTIEARAEVQAVAVALRGREGGATAELGDEVQNCLRASSGGGDKPYVLTAMQVRRLTPVECERLQGFPDFYTQIPWRKKPASECSDGPRYKALGNSWCTKNAKWIGIRMDAQIRMLDQIDMLEAA
jgi:DNA (cytosine-5)-methyltransferase 1